MKSINYLGITLSGRYVPGRAVRLVLRTHSLSSSPLHIADAINIFLTINQSKNHVRRNKKSENRKSP